MADKDSAEDFTIICPQCERQSRARVEWIGSEVRCPHCDRFMQVPPRSAEDRPVRSGPPRTVPAQRFSFACPRCQSLLESHTEMSGQSGRCPTCNAQFVVPGLDPGIGRAYGAQLLDSDDQDPTPMHAYAASGQQAPSIRRQDDGTLQIECPRCGARSDVGADNCAGCGTPFTVEGIVSPAGRRGHSLAVTSLVLGVVSVPCFVLYVAGPLAIVFGIASWLKQGTVRPTGYALAGIILGAFSTLVSILVRL